MTTWHYVALLAFPVGMIVGDRIWPDSRLSIPAHAGGHSRALVHILTAAAVLLAVAITVVAEGLGAVIAAAIPALFIMGVARSIHARIAAAHERNDSQQ
ncbi:MAG: hypothetical protein Q4G34_01050 [Micrococcus sp.]|nr:hypothetical protein [Micrococcus sp.]